MNYKIKILGIILISNLFIGCISLTESKNREELISAFENNFGFKPPKSVKEIKEKRYGIYDTAVYWMSFTYDSIVYKKILAHDQPLQIAYKNTTEFNEASKEISESVNSPNWFKLPKFTTEKIHYKKNFLKHTFSEYYIWTNKKTTFLYVHYFD
jgi:hypothetical protein